VSGLFFVVLFSSPSPWSRVTRWCALTVSGLLTVGLLATGGTAVAAVQTPEPTATASATPTASPSPSDTPSSVPAESSPSPAAPDPAPSASTPTPGSSEAPAPAPTPTATPSASATPAPSASGQTSAPSVRTRLAAPRANIGIMAAGVPNDPTQMWIEDFENVSGTDAAQLGPYSSSAYYADAFWLNYAQCNGVLAEYGTPDASLSSMCTTSGQASRNNVRRLADVLGQVSNSVTGGTAIGTPVNGTSTASQLNRSLTEWTENTAGTAGQNVVVRRATAPGIVAAGSNDARYYTLSLDMAEASCSFGTAPASRAQITLGVLLGASNTPVSTSRVISPCTDTAIATKWYTSNLVAPATDWGNGGTGVAAGRYISDQTVQLTAAQLATLRPEVRNANVSAGGNDLAVDNLRVLDVTPALDVAFSSGTVTAGSPSTLTFTITNTSELNAKTDWRFTTALPSGVVIAPTPAQGGTCVDATGTPFAVTAAAGSSSVGVVGGDLTAGMASCTITVQVVAANTGTYTIAPSATTASTLVAPSATSMTVTAPATITIQKNVISRAAQTDQFQLSLSSGATTVASATTAGSSTGIQSAQVGPIAVTRGATYTISEAVQPATTLSTYTTTYECRKNGTLIASGTETSGALTIPDEAGAQIVCIFANTAVTGGKFYCDANYVYGLRQDGTIVQGYAPTGTATALPGAPTGVTTANSLAIDPSGTTAWAVVRSTDLNTAPTVIKYTVAGGTVTSATQTVTTQATGTGTVVAGAVDAKGNFIIGKADASAFRLYRYNEASTSFVQLGYINTGGVARNGDFAFDRQGNLFVLQSVGGMQQMYSVTTANYDAALTASSATTVIPATATTNKASDVAALVANGIAFSTRGVAYLSSATTIYQFDPMTWNTISGTQTITGGTTANPLTDLASCAAPSTIALDKQVVGRRTGGAADNFTISLAVGGSTVATASTTVGTTVNNAASIAPLPALVNSQVTISETMVNGLADVSSFYSPVYECWANGVRISSVKAASGTITIPNQAGVGVACTFYNTPQASATVTLRKAVTDGAAANPQAASGWAVSTQITSSTGTATLPTDAANQSTKKSNLVTGADGSATFLILFGTATSTANITIAETQQTGYQFLSLTCVGVTPNPATTTSGTTISAALTAAVTPGSTVDCTFSNRPTAQLTLVKSVVQPASASPSTWTLGATRSNAGALAGPTGTTGTAATTNQPVSAGVSYNLAESGGTAEYLQSGNWVCTNSTTGQSVAVSAAGDVTFPQGGNVTCTVTNATSRIVLIKTVSSGSFLPSAWTLTATPATLTGLSAKSVPGSATGNVIEVRPGYSYTLSEANTDPVAGPKTWYQTTLQQCSDAAGNGCVTVGPTITTPAVGTTTGTAYYRFVNAQAPVIALPLTGGPSSDAFLILGAGVLAVAVAAALVTAWRRSRRSAS
jgi:hypothetical protein